MSGTLRFDANLKWLFTELPFEQRFDAAAAAGFTAVEYASPYELPIDVLQHRLADAGLQTVLINSPAGGADSPTRNGSACIPELVQEFRDGFRLALEYATAVHSSFIHVLGGICPDGVSWDDAFAVYVDNIAWAAATSESSGVRLVLEAINQRDVPGFVLKSQEQAVSVIKAVGGNVGLLFDVYHCQVQQGDLVSRLHALLPMIAHVQVADPPHRGEPGSGEIAWPFVLGHLRDAGYDGWIGCEYRPTTTTVDSLGWLDQFRRLDHPNDSASRS